MVAVVVVRAVVARAVTVMGGSGSGGIVANHLLCVDVFFLSRD